MPYIFILLFTLSTISMANDIQVSINDIAKAVEMLISEVNELKKTSQVKDTERDRKIVEIQSQVEHLQTIEEKVNRLEEDKRRFGVSVGTTDKPTVSTEPQHDIQIDPLSAPFEAVINVRVRKLPLSSSEILYVLPGGAIANVSRIEKGFGFIGNGWCSMSYLKPLKKESK